MLLENKVALITGSSRGIGAATAKLFAKNGASVAVNYNKNEESANQIVREIVDAGGKAFPVHADVTDIQQVSKMIMKVEDQLGKIDVLVLNAGLNFKPMSFMEMEWDEFAHKYVGELQASWNCCKLVVPSMIERHSGCIIAVSSGLSKRSGPGFIAHSASKAGLNSFVKSLALELSPFGIRINAIAPGLTLTDATKWMPKERIEASSQISPMKRIGLPEDMAGVILFLASDQARFVTGGYIPVDGGMTML